MQKERQETLRGCKRLQEAGDKGVSLIRRVSDCYPSG